MTKELTPEQQRKNREQVATANNKAVARDYGLIRRTPLGKVHVTATALSEPGQVISLAEARAKREARA